MTRCQYRGPNAVGIRAPSPSPTRAAHHLLAKVFAIDVLACPECEGRLRLIAFIPDSQAAKRILDHLGLDATGLPIAPRRTVAEDFEPAPGHDLVDPVFEG